MKFYIYYKNIFKVDINGIAGVKIMILNSFIWFNFVILNKNNI